MKISDLIEEFIKEIMDEEEGVAVIRRNELAGKLNCVPSQINYVINSRFTNDHGYIVESRRGGGGSIKITRIHTERNGYLMHIVSSIGNSITQQEAIMFIKNLYDFDSLTEKEGKIMLAGVSDKAMRQIPQALRDTIRADLFKNMLVSIIE